MNSLKVLHLNTYDIFGGAAKGMYILHTALLKLGINSQVLVHHKDTNDTQVIPIYTQKEKKERFDLDLLPLHMYPERNLDHISNAIVDSNLLIEQINTINPDIVHMHWVNYAYLSIEDIQRINKPIIWTLRDMWAFTGGCHHALDCDRFKIGCGQCPILKTDEINDITQQQYIRKIETYNNADLTLVGISPWVEKNLRDSFITQKTNIKIDQIDNNFDSTHFYQVKKSSSFNRLKINTTKHILSIGAHSLNDQHKGIKYFIDMLNYLNRDDYFIILFGEENQALFNKIQCEYKSFGFIHEPNILRDIYTISDIFIAPSLLEPFGKTIVEAMACGTPVVCFENSGGPDYIVTHKQDGYKAKKFDSHDLANGVKWIISCKDKKLSSNALTKASTFSSEKIAQQYTKLYEKTIEKFNYTYKDTPISLHDYECLIKIEEFQHLIEQLKNEKKILIYGYSYIGKYIHSHLPDNIVGFLDMDTTKIDNKLIYHPKDIHNLSYDFILITVLNRYDVICEYLLSLNIKKDKMINILSKLR